MQYHPVQVVEYPNNEIRPDHQELMPEWERRLLSEFLYSRHPLSNKK